MSKKTNQGLLRRDFYSKKLLQGRERDYCNRENAMIIRAESIAKSNKIDRKVFLFYGKGRGKQNLWSRC